MVASFRPMGNVFILRCLFGNIYVACPLHFPLPTSGCEWINRIPINEEDTTMKRRVLMAVAGFGLSVLIAGVGSAFAGENNVDPWQSWGPVETGALPQADSSKQATGTA